VTGIPPADAVDLLVGILMPHPFRCTRRLFLLLLPLLTGLVTTGWSQTPLPERLLTPADLEKVGMKGTVRPSAEMYDPKEGLHFVRETDSALVLAVAAPGGAGSLKETVQLLAKDAAPVAGVGDEAYSGLAGWMLMFRKGGTTIQMLTGMDLSTGKVFLSMAQMTELAKLIVARL
jgi:hypothetical protein